MALHKFGINLHADCDACDAYNEGTCGGRSVHVPYCKHSDRATMKSVLENVIILRSELKNVNKSDQVYQAAILSSLKFWLNYYYELKEGVYNE
jgi:hypothetical protein